jgi:hypothetical protein
VPKCRKLILKTTHNFQFILLTFLFWAPIFHRNFQLGVCGFVPSHGGIRNIILLHTHTHTSYFLSTSLTLTLFTPLASHTQHCLEPKNTYIFCCVLFQLPTCVFVSSMFLTMGEMRISTWYLGTEPGSLTNRYPRLLPQKRIFSPA